MFIFHFPISMLLEWYERPGRVKYKAVKWQVTARSEGSGRNLVLSISLPFMCIAKQLVQTNRQSSAGASSCTPLPFHTDTQMHLQPPPPQPMKLPALLLQNVWEVQTADRISTARDTSRWGLLRERVCVCVCVWVLQPQTSGRWQKHTQVSHYMLTCYAHSHTKRPKDTYVVSYLTYTLHFLHMT